MTDQILDAWDKGAAMPGRAPPPAEPPVRREEPGDPWGDAPFVCLGKSGVNYWFFDAAGELVSLSARALSQWSEVQSLCGGDDDWLARHWPAFDRDGNPTDGFSARRAAGAIMRRAASLPLFDPAEPRRRYGLWPVPDKDGAPGAALHLGTKVIWCGREERAGFSRAGALWPTLAPRPAPAPPGDAAVGIALEALFARWSWVHPDSAAVLLGLVVNGMLGGLASWRAHGFVVGEAGTGKTALLTFCAALCPLTIYRNEFTEAGIRQMLSETSASVILDEAEGDDHGDVKLRRVIELLRRSSSGQGVSGVRGSPEQAARSFSLAAQAILGGTLPPALTPQDATRITMLQLRPLGPDSRPVEGECAAFLAQHAPALWGRAVASAGRILGLFARLKERLVVDGCSRRAADQLGIVAACHWAMTTEAHHDPDADDHPSVAEALLPVRWLVVPEAEREADSGGNQALQRLLAMPMEMAGDKLLLGQALLRFRRVSRQLVEMDSTWPDRGATEAERDKLDRLLQAHGVRWASLPLRPSAEAPAPPPGLYVAAGSHPRLLRAFEGTPWAGQRWAAAIAQLPEAKGGREAPAVHIGGGKMRTCWVSKATLDRLTGDD